MRSRALSCFALVLVACGASESPPSRSASEPSPASAPAGCPAAFGAGTVDCTQSPGLQCAYPEGQCYCGQPRLCQGMAPVPEPDSWQCVPSQPPCPELGTSCEPGDVGCSPWCCGMAVVCVDGVWTPQEVPCPP